MTKQEYIQELYDHLKNIHGNQLTISIGWSQTDGHYIRFWGIEDSNVLINIVKRGDNNYMRFDQSNKDYTRLKIIYENLVN